MEQINRYHHKVLIASAVVYLFAAWFSIGFYHWDEQFQIIEFAWFKLGNSALSTLAWEYEAAIRPGLQPLLAYLLIKGSQAVGITEPMTLAFVLRAFSAICCVLCVYFFVKVFLGDIKEKKHQKLFIFLSYFFYFMPFMAVRFSSETWSAMMFIVGLAYLRKYLEKPALLQVFLSGVFLGLSFQFRYQAGIMIFGLALWLLAYHPRKILSWLKLFGGFVATSVVALFVDYWLYGKFTLPFIAYFDVNLNQNKAAEFGVSPWWWYFKEMLQSDGIAAVQVIMIILLVVFIVRSYKSFFTWIVVPFVLIHSAIGHKEFRFLFPLVFLLPYMMTSGISYLSNLRINRKIMAVVGVGILFINIAGVVATTLSPAMSCVRAFDYLRKEAVDCEAHHTEWYFMLLNDSAKIRMSFYYPKSIRGAHYDTSKLDSLDYFKEVHADQFIATTKHEYVDHSKWVPVCKALPPWLEAINFNNWMRIKDGGWVLYRRKL